MNAFKAIYLICLTLSSVACSCSFFEERSTPHRDETHVLLQEAQQHRQRAIDSTERELQLKEVGSALQLYLQLEQKLQDKGKLPSPELNSAIASAYALLQQPGWALFYYHQALSQTPQDLQLREKIDTLEREIGIPPSTSHSTWFDYQHLLDGVAILWTIGFLFGACAIFFHSKRFKQCGIGCGILGVLILLMALYARHAAPVFGIIVESTPLYRTPTAYGPSQPARILLEGMQVEVLGISPDPTYLMVRLKGQTVPLYVPSRSIRLIQQTL